MVDSKEQLLELTRCALWSTELNMTLFEESVEWDNLLLLAQEQTLSGLISEAIEKLPLSVRPPRTHALRLHQQVTINRQYRKHQVNVLRELLTLVRKAGVERPVLLKGLGVGQNYPDPSLRMCGDIDLYVGEENYQHVWDFVRSELGIELHDQHSDHHFDFNFMDTTIEIHKFATAPNSVAFRSREFMLWAKSQLEGDALREVSIDGVQAYLPPYEFDFIFIFYHTWRHFLTGGVGLRQLCDWACYTATHADKINANEVKRLITLFRLEKPISIFATIAVQALGAPSNKFFGYASTKQAHYQSALERIWSRGNFGFHNSEITLRSKKGWISRKWLGSIAALRDMAYLMKIDCRYALRFYRLHIGNHIHLAIKSL